MPLNPAVAMIPVSLNPAPLNPAPLNPAPLIPVSLNPAPLNPVSLIPVSLNPVPPDPLPPPGERRSCADAPDGCGASAQDHESWAGEVLRDVAELAAGPRRRLLGLAGAPGAGKSTLAAALADAVPGSVVVPMDGFHLPTDVLRELGRVERRGAPDTFDADGYVALLRRLRDVRGEVLAPAFDRSTEEPVPEAITVPPDAPLVITEGNYLLLPEPPWSAIGDLLDECWFVEVDEAVRVERLVARFVAFGWDPAAARERVTFGSDAVNARLVAASRPRADRIVSLTRPDRARPNLPAPDLT